jgi:hypothetical protein
MRGKYIILIVSAIVGGTGAASWHAANQIGLRIKAATHLAAMAQLNAEERAKAAELALGTSEVAARFAREELVLERSTREAAEQALEKAVNRTAQAASVLAGEDNMTKSVEGGLAGATIGLQSTNEELIRAFAEQSTTKRAMESKLNDLDTTLHLLDEIIAKQVAARRQTQAELDNSRRQVRDLSAQLQQVKTKVEPKAQRSAGKRTAEIKARGNTSNRRDAESRAASNGAQKPTETSAPRPKKPLAVGYTVEESSSPN